MNAKSKELAGGPISKSKPLAPKPIVTKKSQGKKKGVNRSDLKQAIIIALATALQATPISSSKDLILCGFAAIIVLALRNA